MTNQTEVFRESEANNWFSRNKKYLDTIGQGSESLPIEIAELARWLKSFEGSIDKILEIGCSSGRKTELLSQVFDANAFGLDPSDVAVNEGNARLYGSKTQLVCGTSDKLPFSDSTFDFVYFGFCLYLVDRVQLFASISEADRVLKKGGFLAITDFDPGYQRKVPYIHKPGVFSFKQDYSKLFVDTGLYYVVAKNSFSHRINHFDEVSEERVSVTLLYKEKDPYQGQTD